LREIEGKQKVLLEGLRVKGVEVSWHDARQSALEGVLGRGDRRLGQVIMKAVGKGARFDNWSDQFRWEVWEAALAECGLEAEEFLREREEGEVLPWEMIEVGVSRAFLSEERRRAHRGQPTPDCRAWCSGCGISAVGGDGVCPARQAAVSVSS
jgi:hypothetical protein